MGFSFADLVFEADYVGFDGEEFVVDGVCADDALVLGQVAQGFAFGDDGLAGIGGEFAGDDFKQGGFAGAVGADDG